MAVASEPAIVPNSRFTERDPAPVLIFSTVAIMLFLLQAHRFVFTNDEGIVLEAARAMVHGQRPYVDFFGYMSPGSYWIQETFFRFLGVSLWVGRIPVIIDVALQCSLVYWLTAHLSSRRAAWIAAAVFCGFQISDPSYLTAQHRWDSSTFALAGIVLTIGKPTRIRLAFSGALIAMAAWCTPSLLFVAGVVAIWLGSERDRRKHLIPFATGMAIVTGCAAGWLAREGAFSSFLQQMSWLQRNYSGLNVMPYGSVIGGYRQLIETGTGAQLPLRFLLVGCLMLPAILPPAALILSAVAHFRGRISKERRPAILLLSLTIVALVAGTFPRSDLTHLNWISAIPYAVVIAGLARTLPVRTGAILAFTILPFAVLFSLNNVITLSDTKLIKTPVGRLHVATNSASDLQGFIEAVHSEDTLFVNPYSPILYFVSLSRNPTRYSYLLPGFMTKKDSEVALGELRAHPPEWLMYLPLNREEFLRVFPSGARFDQRFAALDEWIQDHYRLADQNVNIEGYRLYHLIFSGHDRPAADIDLDRGSMRSGR